MYRVTGIKMRLLGVKGSVQCLVQKSIEHKPWGWHGEVGPKEGLSGCDFIRPDRQMHVRGSTEAQGISLP